MFSSIVWRWDSVCDVNIPRVISVQQAVFEPFSGRKQVHHCIKKLHKNEGRDRSTGSTTFDRHQTSMDSWVGTMTVVHLSGYDSSTHFPKSTKSVFNIQCIGTLQARYV